MSDDFEFLSVSNRIHQQKKEKKNLSISALIALEIPPSFICCLHDMPCAIGQQIHEKLLQTAYYSQRNSFILPALLMTFVKKSMNLIHFPQISSSSTFILFTNSNHEIAVAIIFTFFKLFPFFWCSKELRYPVFVSRKKPLQVQKQCKLNYLIQ